jgi:hypothetical protein
MDTMVQAPALTLAETSQVLDPPVTADQLRAIVTALGLQPCGYRHTGRKGRPAPCYDATQILKLHAALTPWLDARPNC